MPTHGSLQFAQTAPQKSQQQQQQQQQQLQEPSQAQFLKSGVAARPPNRFFQFNGEKNRPPRRVYARIDSVEREGTEWLALFDAIDASWFDEQALQGPIDDDTAREMPVAVIEANVADQDPLQQDRYSVWIVPGNWAEVRLDAGERDQPVKYYSGLFGEGTDLFATFVRVPPVLSRSLNAAFSLKNLRNASERKIREILDRSRDTTLINVLDVGQGNAIGLWSFRAGAQLYFDFGGGVLGNAKTFPRANSILCLTHSPPIVLSHWDWDHWSSGLRFPDKALECDWLVPRQQLGAVHRAFASELHSRGKLHIWPPSLPSAGGGQVLVQRCRGSNQNDSGLAMIVSAPPSKRKRRVVLLPGDAEYRWIPSVARRTRFDGLVVSHHGSQLGSIARVPAPSRGGPLVYSYGNGNTFGHPRLRAQLDYLTAGWKPRNSYATTQSVRRRPCNIGVELGSATTPTGCPACIPRFIARL